MIFFAHLKKPGLRNTYKFFCYKKKIYKEYNFYIIKNKKEKWNFSILIFFHRSNFYKLTFSRAFFFYFDVLCIQISVGSRLTGLRLEIDNRLIVDFLYINRLTVDFLYKSTK